MIVAEVGNAEVKFKIGYYFESGIAIPALLNNTRDWYLKATIQNSGAAKCRLATCMSGILNLFKRSGSLN